ncbi:MAG: hypothetical protein ACOC9T_02025, partial [Myxococcota bacterium]
MTQPTSSDLLDQQQQRTIVNRPDERERAFADGDPTLDPAGFLMFLQFSDTIPPWGTRVQERDRQMRAFSAQEPIMNSALANIAARNMSLPWNLSGEDDEMLEFSHLILQTANLGKGWTNFVGQVSRDLYTQDKGAFVEIIRRGPREDDPAIGLQHLDSQRCWHTGDPEVPVIYQDRHGTKHRLQWHQVWTLSEMPAPHEHLYGMQYCAVTRALLRARTMQGIETIDDEKANGRWSRAVHFVSNVQSQQVQAALQEQQRIADNSGNTRYIQPAVVANLNPERPITVETLELASLPDGFDRKQALQDYLTVLSMA